MKIGKLISSTGDLSVVRDGRLFTLKLGDDIYLGDVTLGVGIIQTIHGDTVPVAGQVSMTLEFMGLVNKQDSAAEASSGDVIVDALNRGEDLNVTLDATAAGLTGGESGGNSFVQLTRISESVTGNKYGYNYQGLDLLPIEEGLPERERGDGTQEVSYETEDVTPEEPPTSDDPVENPKGNNGKGNGVDNAPGNSGNTKGDDADGSNTPGTIDTKDVLDDDSTKIKIKGNNGWGNGDQDAPGNSLTHNGAENDISLDNELTKHLKGHGHGAG